MSNPRPVRSGWRVSSARGRRWAVAVVLFGFAGVALAQDAPADPAPPAAAPESAPAATPADPTSPAPPAAAPAANAGDKAFSQEELDQILAPIALYPDSLLSQVLMAATYPLEVVEAERWVKANGKVESPVQAKALDDQSWDASVKSLVNFPDVLSMMSEDLDTTKKLGDAFIQQQEQVLATVQTLRDKAKAQGNLESNEQQTVTVEDGEPQIIVIESSDPDVIYVPTYNPTVIYGTWWYPSYPPPPYYPAHRPAAGFGIGFTLGMAWGYAWGGCNWHDHDIDIDIDRNVNRNRNIDRSKYEANFGGRDRGTWQHDPTHRRGVSYRDPQTAQRFSQTRQRQAAQARESFRGRADQGRQELSRGDAAQYRDSRTGNRTLSGQGYDRSLPSNAARDRAPSFSSTDRAFKGVSQPGRVTRDASRRGQVSRSSGSYRGGGGGAMRGGGGARGGRR